VDHSEDQAINAAGMCRAWWMAEVSLTLARTFFTDLSQLQSRLPRAASVLDALF
jgi:hypothetical protein